MKLSRRQIKILRWSGREPFPLDRDPRENLCQIFQFHRIAVLNLIAKIAFIWLVQLFGIAKNEAQLLKRFGRKTLANPFVLVT